MDTKGIENEPYIIGREDGYRLGRREERKYVVVNTIGAATLLMTVALIMDWESQMYAAAGMVGAALYHLLASGWLRKILHHDNKNGELR